MPRGYIARQKMPGKIILMIFHPFSGLFTPFFQGVNFELFGIYATFVR